MDPGLVSSLSGALAQSRRVDMITNNLANADTPAFKADELIFEESLQAAHKNDLRADVPERPFKDSEILSRVGDEQRVVLHGSEFTDLRSGSYRQTANPLDFAIEGNGFFEVLTPGGVRLTRAGNLTLDNTGRLVTHDGFLVLGAGSPGQDPALRALSVGSNQITVDLDGNIYSSQANGGTNIGRLSLVKVENPAALKKVGSNLFESSPEAFAKPTAAQPNVATASLNNPFTAGRSPASAGAPAGPNSAGQPNPLGPTFVPPRVRQGALEASNVSAISEMTKLIEAHRMFDQNLKLMQVQGDASARVSEVGKF